MWHADSTQIRYSPWSDDAFHFSYLVPDFSLTPREIITISQIKSSYTGYDSWVQLYLRDVEISWVADILKSITDHPARRVHIAGISCAESLDLLADYYHWLGYYDVRTNQYIIPSDAPVTVSTTLRHILWCEKNKAFLSKKDPTGVPYYAVVPPLRTPSDLRSLQQGCRIGLVTAMTVSPLDGVYFSEILTRQILTPFQLSQLIYYRWKQFWFSGEEHDFSLLFPHFSESL